ncbi:hypothetical protein L861_21415 [Litchfieldella anticariensis FP35 = DSM 16096]|uniref:Uncharacterized protein n=1 Tax=Litchfieldella anticariensis (strain DSM 16096 / CECT 5854 / CIP 108499 / LMG 22089 / FP35) TaxID=1121939 RepID=S2KI40_LITA3|nr:hypothetical protein [Halomonas anticariensis]EPC01787.1 hypothetical protein L861_21415 [Halomonas anticariensis FP35 = DSM 16096]
MTTEPQRLQYLEAMGVTAWVGRYRLPNAWPTPECEWELPESPAIRTPGERLHGLLEDQPSVRTQEPSSEPAPRQSGRARALLGEPLAPPEVPITSRGEEASAPESTLQETSSEPQQALRFTLQVAALEGRWLVLIPGTQPLDAMSLRLLANILRAADIVLEGSLEFQTFRWPMMDELPVEAPLEEACDGLRAFIDGRRRQGWRPERVIVFGDDDALAQVLAVEEGHSCLLGLPAWWGPSLEVLARDAAAKRDLLPCLPAWRVAWNQQDDETGD